MSESGLYEICQEPSTGLTIEFDGEQRTLEPTLLNEPEYRNEVIEFIAAASDPPVVLLANLLELSDEDRFTALSFFHSSTQPLRYCAAGQSAPLNALFGAVLACMVGTQDLVRFERGKRAALETAVLVHPTMLDGACRQIADRLKSLGVKGTLPQTLLKQAKELLATNVSDDRVADFLDAERQNRGVLANEPVLWFYRNEFYAWEGTHWRQIATAELKTLAVRFLQANDVEVTEKLVRDFMTNMQGKVFLNAWRKPMPLFVEPGQEPRQTGQPTLINFANGIVDVSGVTKVDYSTTIFAMEPWHFTTASLHYEYRPEATCPLWRKTLKQIFPKASPDDHRIEVLQEFMGWSLMHLDMSFEKFLILMGSGRNGKSTVLNTWMGMLGRDGVSHVPMDALGSQFRLGQMNGKFANIVSDMNYIDKVAEGVLKQLTSGDPIQIDRKNLEPITMRPTSKLIFATNSLPQFNDRTDGIWRRMLVIPFTWQVPADQVDNQLGKKLLNELPGIFNWAAEGAARLRALGRFTACSVCQAVLDEHRTSCDPLAQFVEERLELAVDCIEGCQAVYDAYAGFCIDNGRKPKNSAEFGKQLRELMPALKRERKSGGERRYEYVGLKLLGEPSKYGRSRKNNRPVNNSKRFAVVSA